MKQIEELGTCPNCGCSIYIYKTNNYKRFAKCKICGYAYPLPKKGSIENSALICPTREVPILIVENPNSKAYFWSDKPCFSCTKFDKCKQVSELIEEFTQLEVYGY